MRNGLLIWMIIQFLIVITSYAQEQKEDEFVLMSPSAEDTTLQFGFGASVLSQKVKNGYLVHEDAGLELTGSVIYEDFNISVTGEKSASYQEIIGDIGYGIELKALNIRMGYQYDALTDTTSDSDDETVSSTEGKTYIHLSSKETDYLKSDENGSYDWAILYISGEKERYLILGISYSMLIKKNLFNLGLSVSNEYADDRDNTLHNGALNFAIFVPKDSFAISLEANFSMAMNDEAKEKIKQLSKKESSDFSYIKAGLVVAF
jgi:hypothetical protein